ncbi:PhoH family protein [Candidatus Arsenophonus triatominarum]|uniref:PhoH family protein n=1 Tax=Candidatus Arsenophonus triatominarum TaxID=57911 RepID=UPI000B23939C|nr:PhoH family protein [Candidatus Arsenophonus triatominarum]
MASFADFTGIETIGMACETRDRSPIIPRSEAQRKYIEAIKWQKLILANGEAGCGKTFISSAMAADALINKEINKITVTRPVLQAEEDLARVSQSPKKKYKFKNKKKSGCLYFVSLSMH